MGWLPFGRNSEDRLATRLRGGGRRIPLGLVVGGAVCALLVVAVAVLVGLGTSADARSAEAGLRGGRSPWAIRFVEQQELRRDWLSRRATGIEQALFDRISAVIVGRAARSGLADQDSFFAGMFRSFYAGIVQVGFLFAAGLRVWILVFIVGGVLGYQSLRVHQGANLLGETGSGRLFYSGIRTGLQNLNDKGVPDQHVTGLACPLMVPEKTARGCRGAQLLRAYRAENPTNLKLISVLLAYPKVPAYAVLKGEAASLQKAFSGAPLAEHAWEILEGCLALHAALEQGTDNPESQIGSGKSGAVSPPVVQSGPAQLSSRDYVSMLRVSLARVLTPTLREVLAELPAATLATTVLAHEAGKTMAYGPQGDRWYRASNFPQLCARSILHSMPGLAKDYDYEERTTIRRALVYGARSGAFGPVQLPVDLSLESRALRQWVELLMAAPHELAAVTDEVELIGKLWNYHHEWCERFVSSGNAFQSNEQSRVFVTETNLLFLPVSTVIDQLRRVIPRDDLVRVGSLVALVNRRQREHGPVNDEAGEGYGIVDAVRVPRVLEDRELQELANFHGLGDADLRDWSAVRIVLDHFGWLGKRVGNDNVAESYLFRTVSRPRMALPDQNQLGLIGQNGMICFRGSHLAEWWGREWLSRFPTFDEVRIAMNEEDYGRLMRGIAEPEPTEDPVEFT